MNVYTIKSLFKNAQNEKGDEDMALLEFHNTLITGIDTLPAQLLMIESMTGTMLELDVLKSTRAKLYH